MCVIQPGEDSVAAVIHLGGSSHHSGAEPDGLRGLLSAGNSAVGWRNVTFVPPVLHRTLAGGLGEGAV